MQKQSIAVLFGCIVLLVAGGLMVPQLLADPGAPLVRWTQADELDVPSTAGEEGVTVEADGTMQRTAVDLAGSHAAVVDARIEVILRGRVVDKFRAPVAAANVWLDFGRGGFRGGQADRQRRVPDPVLTDKEGRFAFQGQTFRNLSVSLHVLHKDHAPGIFQKDIGEVAAEVDLGDLTLNRGGQLRGRVTDLEGNGISGAELRFQPENGNPMRFVRDRERMLENFTTDNNGYFRRPNLAAGDWSVNANAKRHTEGRSSTFVIEEEQVVDIEDIRLGPGYEVTGYVRTVQGQPIAKANVALQGENRGRGGRSGGGGGGGGRDYRTTTDEQGKFLLEHLPGVPMRLEADAEGYLDFQQDAIDPTSGRVLHLAMQDGLRIVGIVRDPEGNPVTLFAFRAIRLRGLPLPGQSEVNLNDVVAQLRSGNIDEATRNQLRTTMESMRGQMGRPGRGDAQGSGRGGPDPGGGRPGRARDLGKPERHAGGTFLASGLQEGVYEVHVQSPDHARYRSAEAEVRLGQNEPNLAIVLDPGVFVAGIVVDDIGTPVRGATIEMRPSSANEGDAAGRRRGRGNGQADGGMPDLNAMGREFLRQANGVQPTLEATTNAEGLFVIKHAQKGSYRLQAEAKGHSTATSEIFELLADRSGFELRVGALGTIAGIVRGLRSGEPEQARVAAVPVGSGGGMGGIGAMFGRGGGGNALQGVSVASNGTYRIEGLAPGEYIVRSWIGSPQELMRELMPLFMSGSLPADATVRGAEVTAFDVELTRAAAGTVAGTVMHNGSPASGFQVELTRQDDAGSAGSDPGNGRRGGGGGGPGGGRGMWGGMGRSHQSTVAASGRFSIENVPAGLYRLRVQAGRRGGMLHEEIVQVSADTTLERNFNLMTVSLQGSVTPEAGGNVADLDGRVSLLPGLSALPEDLGAWQRENTTFDARVQDGKFRFETLQPGNYLLVVTIRGRERTVMPVAVGGPDQTVQVSAGKV
ncbi:MAG: carboxypeptidase regulatory-like domain-containing protein, partial [Planctomycetota bacterium]